MTKETLNRISLGGLFLYFLGRVISNHVHETAGYIISIIGFLLLLSNVGYKAFHYKEYKKEVWFSISIIIFLILLYFIITLY